MILLLYLRERSQNVSDGNVTLDYDDDGNSNVVLNTNTNPVDVYLIFQNNTVNDKIDRVNIIGSVTFTNEIYGIMWDDADTIAMVIFNVWCNISNFKFDQLDTNKRSYE